MTRRGSGKVISQVLDYLSTHESATSREMAEKFGLKTNTVHQALHKQRRTLVKIVGTQKRPGRTGKPELVWALASSNLNEKSP